MFKTILFASCLFLTGSLHSQELNVKGVVCNMQTREPISYAMLSLKKKQFFGDCDEFGKFNIVAQINDSIHFSCIGYETLTIAISKISTIDSIFLKPIMVAIPEIKINKPTVETYGIINQKMDRSFAGDNNGHRSEVATLIEIPSTVSFFRITKILLRGNKFDDENPIRLHIYSMDSNGMPGVELLKSDIIIKKKSKEKIITIDVKNQNIVMEGESFFVGIQWITSNRVKKFIGPEIFETYRSEKLLTYRRQPNLKNNNWFALYKTNMVFSPGGTLPTNDTPINVLASAEIEVFEKQ